MICCVCLSLCVFVFDNNMFAFVFERPYMQATPGDDPLSWTEPYHRAQACHNVTPIIALQTLQFALRADIFKAVPFTDNTYQNCCYYKCILAGAVCSR